MIKLVVYQYLVINGTVKCLTKSKSLQEFCFVFLFLVGAIG